MTLDGELLRRYATEKSEAAFAELVRRHLDLVYSAALRQVNGDAHLAQDVAQTVFADLARKAKALSQRQALTGWLYASTHFAAANAVRAEARRRAKEQKASSMQETHHAPAPDFDWEKLRPTLDEVMQELKAPDREVILMRYFENRPFAEIGERLSLSEDAARKRVDRALEKLRASLCRRGISISVALGTVLSANAVQIAPAGLAATMTSAALAGAGAGTGTTFAALKMMIMTKYQTGIIGGILVAGALTALVSQHHDLAGLRDQNSDLAHRAAQLAQPPAEKQRLSSPPAAARTAVALSANQFSELLKLRSQAGIQQNELEMLRADLAKAGKLAAARERASKNYFPKAAWASAGYATPEQALQSEQWMLAQAFSQAKDRNRDGLKALIMSTFPPEQQTEMLKVIADHSDSEIADEITRGNDEFAKVDGLRVVNKRMVSDDEAVLTFMNFLNNGTNDSWSQSSFKRVGNEWKSGANF